jgi:CRAL/TRIO domain
LFLFWFSTTDMRPARYFAKETSVKDIIDNLAYCMNTMVEQEKACSEGIGFLAYMNDWSMKNFDVNYCYQFMMMLQGRVPVRVRLFLIVNPPSWFGTIWSIMKPMLAKDFRKKVHVVQEADMYQHLADNAIEYLPDETEKGKVNTDELVQDFIAYRKHVEGESS